jgi:hypothetical protein
MHTRCSSSHYRKAALRKLALRVEEGAVESIHEDASCCAARLLSCCKGHVTTFGTGRREPEDGIVIDTIPISRTGAES